MKTLFLFVSMLLGTAVFSQVQTAKHPEEAKEIALEDIAANRAQLYLQGGFAPIAYTDAHKAFEKKYGVKFNDFGCVAPDKKIVEAYNLVVFGHLDKTFGNAWKKEIRADVIGFSDYRKKKKS